VELAELSEMQVGERAREENRKREDERLVWTYCCACYSVPFTQYEKRGRGEGEV